MSSIFRFKQPPTVFFRPATSSKRDSNTGFSCKHCKIFKNTYFEKHLRTAASDSSYILHKKLNKIIQEPDLPFVSFWNKKNTLFYLLSFDFIRFITHCHSLSLIVIFCYLLSFVVILSTRCHSLYHSSVFYKQSPPEVFFVEKPFSSISQYSQENTCVAEAYSEPSRTSKMELFAKTVDGF